MLVTGIFIGAVAITVLLTMVLKTNAAVIFLALCGGSVLVTLIGNDTTTLAESFGRGNLVVPVAALVALLLLPPLLAALFLRKSVKSSKMLFQILPAVAAGLTGILLVVPLLSVGAQKTVADNHIWQLLQQYEAVILLVGVFGSLIVAGITARRKHDDGKKHHKH